MGTGFGRFSSQWDPRTTVVFVMHAEKEQLTGPIPGSPQRNTTDFTLGNQKEAFESPHHCDYSQTVLTKKNPNISRVL